MFENQIEEVEKERKELKKSRLNNFVYDPLKLDYKRQDYKCLHCKKRFTSIGIHRHLKLSHGIDYDIIERSMIELNTKLSTLKECQAKFDKLKELLKQKKCHGRNFIGETEECFEREWNECLDELSSKEGEE
jgi:hypothetical protein